MCRSYGLWVKCLALFLAITVWVATFTPYVMAFDVGSYNENATSEYEEVVTTPTAVFVQEPEDMVTAYAITFSYPAPGATVEASGVVGTAPWRLYSDGTLVVDSGVIQATGILAAGIPVNFNTNESPWDSYSEYIYRIIFTGSIVGGTSLNGLFLWLRNVTTIDGLTYFDTSNVTDMNSMFSQMDSLTSLDLSTFDTSNVTNMHAMFAGTQNLTSLDLSHFITNSVTTMSWMFYNTNLTSLDLSHFNTSNVTTMQDMFIYARSLTSLNLSNFNTSNVAIMSGMFYGTDNLTSIDLSSFNTSSVLGMAIMFGEVNREITLGEHFQFASNTGLPIVPTNAQHAGAWRNVGNGTLVFPQGNYIFTSAELVANFDGSTMADTWVWIRQPLAIITYDAPDSTTTLSYNFQFEATGYPAPTWTHTGTLPNGLNLSTTGLLSGTPTVAGNFTFTVTVTNSQGTDNQTVTIEITELPTAPDITSTVPSGVSDIYYNFQFEATGYPDPTWTHTGTLPNGLTLSTTGLLSGIPTVAGNFTFTVTATNSQGTDSQTITIEIAELPTAPEITASTAPSGISDTHYSFQFEATGFPTPEWTHTGDLPTGLTLSTSGLLSGTPTTSGSFTFTVTATNFQGTVNQAITIVITDTPTITTYTATNSVVGFNYNFQFEAIGYPAPTWSYTGNLPTGLTLNTLGVLSGTPTTTGTFTFNIVATNPQGTDSQTVTIVIANQPVAPEITVFTLPYGILDTNYNFQFEGTGFPSPTWSYTGNLPTGLTLNPQGLLSGTPTEPGSFTFTIVATNVQGIVNQTITVIINAIPTITSYNAPTSVVGFNYSFQFEAIAYPAPIWSYTGTLPPGLSFNSTGLLSGTPTTAGTSRVTHLPKKCRTIKENNGCQTTWYYQGFYSTKPAVQQILPLAVINKVRNSCTFNFTVTATNSQGTNSQLVTIEIATQSVAPIITAYNAPNGTEGTSYNFQFEGTGFPSPAWSYTGNLPTGLTLNPQGLLYGTPTQPGSFIFTITANNNTIPNDSREITIEIAPDPTTIAPPPPPSLTITIINGGNGATDTQGLYYAPNTNITIFAGTREGYEFVYWTIPTGSPNVDFNNINSPFAVFTMPDSNVTIIANWTQIENIQPPPLPPPSDDYFYSPNDIAIINRIITNNNLNATVADPPDGSFIPADWTFATWSDGISPVFVQYVSSITPFAAIELRITELSLSSRNLTGSLDIRGLDGLNYLNVANNTLEEVNVTELPVLHTIDARYNNMTSRANVIGVSYPNPPTTVFMFDPQNQMEIQPPVLPPDSPPSTGSGWSNNRPTRFLPNRLPPRRQAATTDESGIAYSDTNDIGIPEYIPSVEPELIYIPHPLSQSALNQIYDAISAARVVERALDYLLDDTGFLTDTSNSILALFAEMAITQAASIYLETDFIIVNLPNVEYLQQIAFTTRAEIMEMFSNREFELNRDINANVAFITTYYEQINILVEPSAIFTDIDRVWIRTPYYDLSFTHSFIQNNAQSPLHIYVSSSANSQRNYTVTFSQPVTESVRLSVPPIPGEPAYQTVMGDSGQNAGGNHNPVTGLLEARVNESGTYTVVDNRIDFADIQNRSQEMQRAIRSLAASGIIDGMTPTEFRPDDPLTRAQVAALVTRVLGINNPNADGGFVDVNRNDWFFVAVNTANRHNIMTGTGGGMFSPHQNTPRDQLVALSARILRTEMRYRNPVNPMNYLQEFTDIDDFADWSLVDLSLATRENLVVRRADGRFMPSNTITRGEAAIILYRLYRRIW